MQSSSGICGEDLGDIEDCVLPGDPRPSDRIRAENKVLPRALRRKVKAVRLSESERSGSQHPDREDTPICESFIPGTQSIYIKTWGCSHNNSDGEYMAGLLGANGYSITGVYTRKLDHCIHITSDFLLVFRFSAKCRFVASQQLHSERALRRRSKEFDS